MTQEEKRIKIAEKCGWKYAPYRQGEPAVWMRPDGFPVSHRATELPDYFNDLNACAEMEKMIHESDPHTRSVWFIQMQSLEWAGISAAAEQRAEAFGKTLNLW